MPKYSVTGVVTGSKHLGVFEAATAEEAIQMAMDDSELTSVNLCHQCSDDCEDPEIHEAVASKIED